MVAGRRTPPDVVTAVVQTKLADMEMTVREVGAEVGVPKSTAHDILEKEFGRLGHEDDLIKAIIRQDAENIALGGLVIRRTIEKVAETGMDPEKIGAMATVMADATKRRQLFTGGATENVAVKTQTYLPEMEE